MTNEWKPFNFDAEVADVARPLASVCKMCEAGHRVILGPSGSYIENIRTGSKTFMDNTGQGCRIKSGARVVRGRCNRKSKSIAKRNRIIL